MLPGGAGSRELELDPEQKRRLGVSGADSVRVLAASPRTVVLEKCGPGQVPLPWDRELVLSADVRAFSMADVLQMIHASAKSGFLYFEHGECAKTVFLHGGEVVFATSNQRVDRLGECLLRACDITAEQQLEAEAAYKPPAPFGRFLVELGFLTPRELWDGVKNQVEEIVRSLFAFGAGTVLFWEGEVRPDNVVRLALPTHRLVEEGLAQRDELLLHLAQLEDPRLRLTPTEGVAARLGGTERAILEALAEDGAFPAMCRRVGIDPLSGARTVRLLCETGALRLEPLGGGEVPDKDTRRRSLEEEALRSCVRAHVKLMAELAAPIVALEGAAGLRERMEEVAEEACERHPLLLENLNLGPGGVLDPEELIARTLRFPGDRQREVRSALGELISYLEFELMNHPLIEDSDAFLEGLDTLRAQL